MTGRPCGISDSGSMFSPGILFDPRLNERRIIRSEFFSYNVLASQTSIPYTNPMGWTNRNRQRSVCLKAMANALAPEESFPQNPETN